MKKLFLLLVAVAAAYGALVLVARPAADALASAVGIPSWVNDRIVAARALLDGTSTALANQAGNLTSTGVTQAIRDANAKLQPLVEQAVGAGQQALSGAAAARQALQEKRQQIDDAAKAADQLMQDYQKLKDSVSAVTSVPTAFSGATASGAARTAATGAVK